METRRIAKGKNANKRRRRVARKAPAQHPSNGFSQGSHVAARFPLFPRQLQFSSNWNRSIEVDLGNSQFQWAIGLFDFLTHIPEYALECYRLWRYCRISAVDVTLTVIGESDEANQNFSFEAAMAKIPYDQVGLTPSELQLVRGSKYTLVPTAGYNKTVLRGHFGSFDELGNPVYDRTYWQSLADANTATPADTSRPVVGISARSINGNRCLATIHIAVIYHMQFFELEYNRLPNLEKPSKAQQAVNYRAKEPRAASSRADNDFAEFSDKSVSSKRR